MSCLILFFFFFFKFHALFTKNLTSVVYLFKHSSNLSFAKEGFESLEDCINYLAQLDTEPIYDHMSIILNSSQIHEIKSSQIFPNTKMSKLSISSDSERNQSIIILLDGRISILFKNLFVYFKNLKFTGKEEEGNFKTLFTFVLCRFNMQNITFSEISFSRRTIFTFYNSTIKVDGFLINRCRLDASFFFLISYDRLDFPVDSSYFRNFIINMTNFMPQSYLIKLVNSEPNILFIIANLTITACQIKSAFMFDLYSKSNNLNKSILVLMNAHFESNFLIQTSIENLIFKIENFNKVYLRNFKLNKLQFNSFISLRNAENFFMENFDNLRGNKILKYFLLQETSSIHFKNFKFIGNSFPMQKKVDDFGFIIYLQNFMWINFLDFIVEKNHILESNFILIGQTEAFDIKKLKYRKFVYIVFSNMHFNENVLLGEFISDASLIRLESDADKLVNIFQNVQLKNNLIDRYEFMRFDDSSFIFVKDLFSKVFFDNCTFIQNEMNHYTSLIIVNIASFVVQKSKFYLSRTSNQNSYAVLKISAITVIINQNDFIRNEIAYFSPIYIKGYHVSVIWLERNNFINNTCWRNGGILQIIEPLANEIFVIKNNIFIKNIAKNMGGCIYFNAEAIFAKFLISNNTFEENNAKNGAILYYRLNKLKYDTTIFFSISEFSKSKNFYIIFDNNQFIDNFVTGFEQDRSVIYFGGQKEFVQRNKFRGNFIFEKNNFLFKNPELENYMLLINQVFEDRLFEFVLSYYQFKNNIFEKLLKKNTIKEINVSNQPFIHFDRIHVLFENNKFFNLLYGTQLISLNLVISIFINNSFANCENFKEFEDASSLILINDSKFNSLSKIYFDQICDNLSFDFEQCQFEALSFFNKLNKICFTKFLNCSFTKNKGTYAGVIYSYCARKVFIYNSQFISNYGIVSGVLYFQLTENILIKASVFHLNKGKNICSCIFISGNVNSNNLIQNAREIKPFATISECEFKNPYTYNDITLQAFKSIELMNKTSTDFPVQIINSTFFYYKNNLVYMHLSVFNLKFCNLSEISNFTQIYLNCIKNITTLDTEKYGSMNMNILNQKIDFSTENITKIIKNLHFISNLNFSEIKQIDINISVATLPNLTFIKSCYMIDYSKTNHHPLPFIVNNQKRGFSFSPFNESYGNHKYFNSFFKFEMDYCFRGEIFDFEINKCRKCESGLYSITLNSEKCLKCKDGMDCSKGGAEIKILDGWWRTDIYSDNVFHCEKHPEECEKDGCREGYTGVKCLGCHVIFFIYFYSILFFLINFNRKKYHFIFKYLLFFILID